MKNNKENKIEFINENKIEFIDDSVDIGKEPLPITNPELEKLCNQIMDKYK